MPLSLGQQQPTSERRKGDQMFGITTVGSDTRHSWMEAARSRVSGPAWLLGSVWPHLLSPSESAQAQNGFSTKLMHVGLFPKKWMGSSTHLEIFISTQNGLSKYPPHQLLSTGQMFLQIKGPVRWPSRSVHWAVICEAAKDKKPQLDH